MRFNKRALGLVAGIVLVVLSVPALAHHSIPSFWKEEASITVTGTVKQIRIMNPHSEIQLDVTDPNGQTATWVAIGSSASGMVKAGWKNDVFKVGTKITVEGAPPRREGAKGVLIRTVQGPDGSKFSLRTVD